MIDFKASNFENKEGLEKCLVDEDFAPYLERMNDSAKKYGITVVVQQALAEPEEELKGAIVPRVKMSNHFIGEGLDADLIFEGKLYNHEAIWEAYNQKGVIYNFINECIENALRWGGLFQKRDEVHWDIATNLRNPALWHQKFNALHPTVC